MSLAFFHFTRWFLRVLMWLAVATQVFLAVLLYRVHQSQRLPVFLILIPLTAVMARRYMKRDMVVMPNPAEPRKMVLRLSLLWTAMIAAIAVTVYVIHVI